MSHILSVDWSNPKLLPAPRTNRPKRRETWYQVTYADQSQGWMRKPDIKRRYPNLLPAEGGSRTVIKQVEAINSDKMMEGRMVRWHPCNMDFPAKPKRLETMKVFMHQPFGWTEPAGLDGAFVGRLFAEGMLEKDTEGRGYKPTVGGRMWFAQNNR